MSKQLKGHVYKGARIEKSEASADDMSAINQFTIEALKAEEVFTFKVVMCDNRIDRQYEAFNEDSLNKMAELFVGKTFIKDHDWSSDNQVARIYETAVVEGGGESDTGERYLQLVAKCYMLINSSTEQLIADIKGGIKKEVSVGFRLESAICSICGVDNMKNLCSHFHGREYDGKICYFIMADVTDSYELSFVAVPAQPAAGATKNYTGKEPVETPPDPTDELNARMRLMGAFLFSEGETHE